MPPFSVSLRFMPSTYQRNFSLLLFLGISATWPPLSDWISSTVYVDTIPGLRQETVRRRVFQTRQLRYSYTPSQPFPLFIYLPALTSLTP